MAAALGEFGSVGVRQIPQLHEVEGDAHLGLVVEGIDHPGLAADRVDPLGCRARAVLGRRHDHDLVLVLRSDHGEATAAHWKQENTLPCVKTSISSAIP